MPVGESKKKELVILARRKTRQITFEGNLEQWHQANHVSFDDGSALSGRRSASVYALWDEENLYIAFDVDRENPRAKVTQRDGHGLWFDDGIEFLIDAKNDKGKLFMPDDIAYHVNILDAVFDDRGTGGPKQDVSWNGDAAHKMNLKTTKDGRVTGYICEVAVPWEELGIVPQENVTVVGIDFCVNGTDDRTGEYHYFDWAGLKLFHYPDGFGELKLAGS
ncbi:MAG: hypothetical protein M1469_04560 [Bacteroidetes bacterium]|nr:hypothetical protein [Bacteroidota bacterium]